MSISLFCSNAGLGFAMREVREAGNRTGYEAARVASSLVTDGADDRQEMEARLMEQVATGDRTAFATLYDRFSGPLHGAALRIVRDPAEAQDIVHDAFVAIWEKAGSFETTRGSAFAWAITLVRNRAIDRVRMRRRRAELLAESTASDFGYNEDAASLASTEVAAQGDDARAVRAAVATLPEDQKRALELAFFSGLTQEEISRKLSEPLGTIKARIRRGLIKLRDSLAHRL